MDTKRIIEHFHDEGDSAYIYDVLYNTTKDTKKKEIFKKLKDKELEHQEKFANLLKQQTIPLPVYNPSIKIRIMAFLAHKGFDESVLKWRIADESKEIRVYFSEASSNDVTKNIARDEALHAKVLQNYLIGNTQEPWHKQESGGILRNVVYGFNDGLTANFGLIMGVIGSAAAPQFIIISGLAGLAADTLSMASSSFLAVQSEKEVYEHELSLEKEEIELMPESEEEELVLIYQARGFSEELAKKAAYEVMHGDPKNALKEMAKEELGITNNPVSPLKEGALTGIATFFGALIPLIPLFFGSTHPYIIAAFIISMISHFAVGAIRSLFTGRGIIRSGIDMFLVGLGVAAAGYGIGYILTGHL